MWQLTSNPLVDVGHRPPQNGVQKQIVQLVLPNIHHQPERGKKNCKMIISSQGRGMAIQEHYTPKFEKSCLRRRLHESKYITFIINSKISSIYLDMNNIS